MQDLNVSKTGVHPGHGIRLSTAKPGGADREGSDREVFGVNATLSDQRCP
jgi:hypothetical protein